MEGGAASGIQTAIVNLATSVSNDVVDMLVAVVPVLAPIVGACIVAYKGYGFIKRLSK